MSPLSPPKALLLDMDGVLYHGEQALPGAVEFLDAIASLPHLFITNNPILSPRAVVARLQRLGLPAYDPADVLTSAQATARWLSREQPGFRYFAVGAEGLHQALAEVGTADPRQADFVVIGEGPGLDFDSLTTGINLLIKRGARLVATNPDTTVDASRDGEHLILPGGGALVAPFAVASGQQPVIIGKPNPLLYEMALDRLGVDAAACLMIGDRPDTDIAGAAGLGMHTALVRTGRFAQGEHWPTGQPVAEIDVDDLPALLAVMHGRWPEWLPGKKKPAGAG